MLNSKLGENLDRKKGKVTTNADKNTEMENRKKK